MGCWLFALRRCRANFDLRSSDNRISDAHVQGKPTTELTCARSAARKGLWFSDGKLYFTAEGSMAIAHYDPQSNKIDWLLGLGQDRTHMITA